MGHIISMILYIIIVIILLFVGYYIYDDLVKDYLNKRKRLQNKNKRIPHQTKKNNKIRTK